MHIDALLLLACHICSSLTSLHSPPDLEPGDFDKSSVRYILQEEELHENRGLRNVLGGLDERVNHDDIFAALITKSLLSVRLCSLQHDIGTL